MIPTILHGQIGTQTPLPESADFADPNAASPQLKSNYFLAEAKFQEEAFLKRNSFFKNSSIHFKKQGFLNALKRI